MKKTIMKKEIIILASILGFLILIQFGRWLWTTKIDHYVLYYLPPVDMYAKVTVSSTARFHVGLSRDKEKLMSYYDDCPEDIDYVSVAISDMTACYGWCINKNADSLFYDSRCVYANGKNLTLVKWDKNKNYEFLEETNNRPRPENKKYDDYLGLYIACDRFFMTFISLKDSDSSAVEIKRVHFFNPNL